jgi:phosphoglycolate phosphatase
MLQKPQAIFFDWDGTLVDSLPALTSYYNHVLSEFGMPLMTEEEARKKIRLSAREIFPIIFGDKAERAFECYYSIVEKTHLQRLKPFPDSEKILRHLAGLNLPMGVVSNKRHGFLLDEIKHLGWDSWLTSNIGAGVAAKDKPAPDALTMAVQQSGIEQATMSIWYVGDTEVDMQAAHSAGIQGIFIEHGMGIVEDIHELGLNSHFVRDSKALIEEIQKFF